MPLDVEVGVLSSSGRRFLEVLGKLDQLMPLLQTLEIHEVLTAQQVDLQRATLKRQVRDLANGTRNFAMGLRRRMNALAALAARDGAESAAGDAEAEPSEPVLALEDPGARVNAEDGSVAGAAASGQEATDLLVESAVPATPD